jgi:hypothetical protein
MPGVDEPVREPPLCRPLGTHHRADDGGTVSCGGPSRRSRRRCSRSSSASSKPDNIVVRTVFDQVPPKVVYSVAETERDRADDVLRALCERGLYWCANTGARIVVFDEPAASRA